MSKELKILIVDDVSLIYDTLVRDLRKNPHFKIVANRNLKNIETQAIQYDVIILDMEFKDEKHAGLNVLSALVERKKNIKIIIYSTHIDLAMIQTAKDLGAIAYIYKNDRNGKEDLIKILNDLNDGEEFKFHNWSSASVQDKLASNNHHKKLEPFEISILKYKAEGYSSNEVTKKIRKEYQRNVDVNIFLRSFANKNKIQNDKGAITAFAIKKKYIKPDELSIKKA